MPFSERRELRWAYLGQVAYPRAERLQADLRDRVRRDREADYLVLLEHPHVFTLGRNAERADILADDAWLQDHQTAIFDCDRGGRGNYTGGSGSRGGKGSSFPVGSGGQRQLPNRWQHRHQCGRHQRAALRHDAQPGARVAVITMRPRLGSCPRGQTDTIAGTTACTKRQLL